MARKTGTGSNFAAFAKLRACTRICHRESCSSESAPHYTSGMRNHLMLRDTEAMLARRVPPLERRQALRVSGGEKVRKMTFKGGRWRFDYSQRTGSLTVLLVFWGVK